MKETNQIRENAKLIRIIAGLREEKRIRFDTAKDMQKLFDLWKQCVINKIKKIATPVYQKYKYDKKCLRNYVIKKKDFQELIDMLSGEETVYNPVTGTRYKIKNGKLIKGEKT